jgi:glycerate 2-kinase
MRILIAPDKFKGSLSAREVAENIEAGLRGVLPNAQIDIVPVADGGEGTADVIGQACAGERVNCEAHDAIGREIAADYVWLSDRATAVMEMSAAAGMWRIKPDERDLLCADTFGVGEMIKDAVRFGAREILIGLGGSATNDGGFGMALSLGFQFLANEHEIETPAELVNLARIKSPTRQS